MRNSSHYINKNKGIELRYNNTPHQIVEFLKKMRPNAKSVLIEPYSRLNCPFIDEGTIPT
ncbi:MAG: hypothetical protein ACI9AQ_001276 [Dinoroseobacter sp.]|jgi:hypothetical protein